MKPLRILAVEDNPADLRLLKVYLGEDPALSVEILHAGTLQQALGRLAAGAFDAVLLDLNLPDSHGLEGLEKIAAIKPMPTVIVLTGSDDVQTGLLALSKGAQDYLVKGKIGGDALVRSIRYSMARSQAEEAARHLTAELAARAADIQRANEEWKRTFDTIPDLIAILDERHRVVRMNQAMARKLGRTPEACAGAACFEVVHGCRSAPDACPHTLTLRDGKEHTVEVHEERLGGDFLVTTTPLKDAHGQMVGTVHVARDITERKRNEEHLKRVNRSLNALSHSGQALLRATDEAAFLDEACKIIVQDCGYAMVWIGFAEHDEARSIRPAAFAGCEQGYLETLQLTWADTDRGRGPSGKAIRTGQVCQCRDMLTDPDLLPWREEARRRGCAAAIALPLLAGGQAFGALSIYAQTTNGFAEEEEVKLLTDLAADFTHGITLLRTHAAKERAEAELRAMQQREKVDAVRMAWGQSAIDTVNAMREGVALLEMDGTIISVNPAVERLTGSAGGAIVGRNLAPLLSAFLVGDDLKTAQFGLSVVRGGGVPEFPPLFFRRPDGTNFHVLPSVALMNAPEGGRQVVVLTLKDVTELHDMAQRLRKLAGRLAIAEEEDRWRISRYIHDTVIQNLSLSNIRLGTMLQPLQDASLKEEADRLLQIRELLRQAIDECRMVMSDLTPALLYELGLLPALNDFAQRLDAKHGVRVIVEAGGREPPIANALRGLLFESARELIMNALKHAGPCEIRVTVNCTAHDLILRVSDNGKGIVSSDVFKPAERQGGFGLLNIRQRVVGLGGRLEIVSKPGKGTTATIHVPLGAGQ